MKLVVKFLDYKKDKMDFISIFKVCTLKILFIYFYFLITDLDYI